MQNINKALAIAIESELPLCPKVDDGFPGYLIDGIYTPVIFIVIVWIIINRGSK